MQGGFSFNPLKVTTVNHYLLMYGGARACAGFAHQGVWEGGMGIELLQQVVVSQLG